MPEKESSVPGLDGIALFEEIKLLVDMVIERAGPWVESVLASGHEGIHQCANSFSSGESDSGRSAKAENPPAWCPLCTVVSMIHGERPEFLNVMIEQAAQLIALLRAVLADRWNPEAGIHMPGFQPPSPPAEQNSDTDREGRVHRIPVRRRAQWS